MTVHFRPHRVHHRRQDTDPLAAPTADGISNSALTVGDQGGTAATLAIDQSVVATGTAAPSFVRSDSAPQETTSSEEAAATSQASDSPSGNEIPLGTVIGACVGAFAGAAILILAGIWLYKRSAPKSRRRGGPISPLSATRNVHGDLDRSRSGRERWNKLEEMNDDKWEGKYQTQEVTQTETIGPMEKLTMFKKSTPSVRTEYTYKSEELPTFNLEPHPFAKYHPDLAKELASSDSLPAHPFLGKVDTGPALTWERESVGDDSFLSLRSARLSGAMSPSLPIAIPTPIVTSSEPHHWESAEVVDFEGQSAEIVDSYGDSNDPFTHPVERKKSSNNPFFNAQSAQTHSLPKPFARSSGAYSPASVDKGKARDFTGSDVDPFQDPTPQPQINHLSTVDSMFSDSTNDRAIQSLIAVLDVSSAEVQERLRVASMQPSFVSNTSMYTATSALEGEEDVTDSFPLPPTSAGPGLSAGVYRP